MRSNPRREASFICSLRQLRGTGSDQTEQRKRAQTLKDTSHARTVQSDYCCEKSPYCGARANPAPTVEHPRGHHSKNCLLFPAREPGAKKVLGPGPTRPRFAAAALDPLPREELSPAQHLLQRPQPELGGEIMERADGSTENQEPLQGPHVDACRDLETGCEPVLLSGRSPVVQGPACPDGWVGYGGKCFCFSEAEGNWTYSRSNCSALGASLAGIDSPQEMAFLLRHKGKFDHWIGLRRDPGQLWKWANGTEFNNLFEIRGGGDCASLSENGVGSLRCTSEGRWICKKPDVFTAAKETPAGGGS